MIGQLLGRFARWRHQIVPFITFHPSKACRAEDVYENGRTVIVTCEHGLIFWVRPFWGCARREEKS